MLGAEERSGQARGDIGQSVFPGHAELFVDAAPAVALQQQFHKVRSEFIVVHEIGTAWSRKLLAGIASASGRELQQLDIRREGVGTILATIEYVECPATDGSALRIYTTDMSADLAASTATRQQIALVLLAYARLGVVMVGDMSVPSMRAAFHPIHQGMREGPWPSRNLLLLPLTSAGALASVGSDISDETGVTVRTTPQVTRTADAWAFISGTWNRLREELRARGGGYAGQSVSLPALPGARGASASASPKNAASATASTDAGATPAAPRDGVQAVAQAPAGVTDPTALGRFVEKLSALPGLTACCVFATPHGNEVGDVTWPGLPFFVRSASDGGRPSSSVPTAASLSAQGRQLVRAIRSSASDLGLRCRVPEVIVSVDDGHLLLRPVPGRPDLVLLALFAKSERPMLFDLQLQRVEAEFIAGTR
ncbi:hypothetical protein BH09PSE5_BH09PSE5_41090 [soil metagenome]